MNTKRNRLNAMSLAGVFLFTGAVALAEEYPKSGDLNNYQCKDIMRLSGEDRDIAIGVFHGYLLGKKNTTKYDAQKLAGATDEVLEFCLDNPNTKALQAFEKFGQ